MSAERPHANYAPSKLKWFELSPMWLPDPNQETHWKTDRGSRCHTALETGDDSQLKDQEPEWVKKCRDWMAAFEGWECHREIKLEVDDEIYGYADVIYLRGDFAVLVDFKFSENPQEPTETNPAAQAYILGVFNRWPQVQQIKVAYLYPIRDEVDQAEYERSDIPRIQLRLETIKARVKEATTCEPHYETCIYCGRKASCKQLHQMALPIATRYAETHELTIPAQYDPSLITDPATMGHALTAAQVLEKWADSVKFHAVKLRQETGQEIPGYTYQSRSGRKTITAPTRAWSVCESYMGHEDFLAACDVSVKTLCDRAAEKAEKGQKAKLKTKLENDLRDAGVLEVGPDTYYLKRTK